MLKRILKIILNRFPTWAFGLECKICTMSFGNANNHEEYVDSVDSVDGLRAKHIGKIPILRK